MNGDTQICSKAIIYAYFCFLIYGRVTEVSTLLLLLVAMSDSFMGFTVVIRNALLQCIPKSCTVCLCHDDGVNNLRYGYRFYRPHITYKYRKISILTSWNRKKKYFQIK